MTTKTVIVCDWCGKYPLSGATFESGSYYGKNIHICDSCQSDHHDFEVCHKRWILEDPNLVFENEQDKNSTMDWGIVEYRKDTNKYHFVKWIQEG